MAESERRGVLMGGCGQTGGRQLAGGPGSDPRPSGRPLSPRPGYARGVGVTPRPRLPGSPGPVVGMPAHICQLSLCKWRDFLLFNSTRTRSACFLLPVRECRPQRGHLQQPILGRGWPRPPDCWREGGGRLATGSCRAPGARWAQPPAWPSWPGTLAQASEAPWGEAGTPPPNPSQASESRRGGHGCSSLPEPPETRIWGSARARGTVPSSPLGLEPSRRDTPRAIALHAPPLLARSFIHEP